ncbi:hypothetical protein Bhyg_03766 [Pseudolycoriella hygida]|uniref:Uncharacterized protein n=1 Tax=Pseudolycoriella hygida TaxID=35572 RepID=A0A9Q0NDX0_9DIPT|nr:hypothetical protein Bhyg_03766 [Pseudolycoriella hygida]
MGRSITSRYLSQVAAISSTIATARTTQNSEMDRPLNISAESGKAMSLSLIRDHDVSEEELENNLLEGNDEPFDKDLSLDRTIQNISINLGDLLVTAKSSNLSESPEDSGFSGKLEATTPTALDHYYSIMIQGTTRLFQLHNSTIATFALAINTG